MCQPDELLRQARRARGLTQAQLAARSGTSQEQVSRWESGKRSPTVAQLGKLLAVLGFELALRPVESAREMRGVPADEVRAALRRGRPSEPGDRPRWA